MSQYPRDSRRNPPRSKGDSRPTRDGPRQGPRGPRPDSRGDDRASEPRAPKRPPLTIFPTTLWEYPSQHYDAWLDDSGKVRTSRFAGRSGQLAMQGDQAYEGATPSWVIWQVLMRYTKPGDVVVDPMCGSGTTLDVCADLDRKCLAFDLVPSRSDIKRNDARKLPVPTESVDLAFVDPPYGTHIDYSDDRACIGKLDAGGEDGGDAYYEAMGRVLGELHRVLKPGGVLAIYVSDSFKKRKSKPGGTFIPIGFALFEMCFEHMTPIDLISVVRHSQKLDRGNFRKAAEEQNFYLRGFNHLILFRKEADPIDGPVHGPHDRDDDDEPGDPLQFDDDAPRPRQGPRSGPGGARPGPNRAGPRSGSGPRGPRNQGRPSGPPSRGPKTHRR